MKNSSSFSYFHKLFSERNEVVTKDCQLYMDINGDIRKFYSFMYGLICSHMAVTHENKNKFIISSRNLSITLYVILT